MTDIRGRIRRLESGDGKQPPTPRPPSVVRYGRAETIGDAAARTLNAWLRETPAAELPAPGEWSFLATPAPVSLETWMTDAAVVRARHAELQSEMRARWEGAE